MTNADLDVLFAKAMPVQITLTKGHELVWLIHCIVRTYLGGNVDDANLFLQEILAGIDKCGLDRSIDDGLTWLERQANYKPPSYLKPLLKLSFATSTDSETKKKFDEYLKTKTSQPPNESK